MLRPSAGQESQIISRVMMQVCSIPFPVSDLAPLASALPVSHAVACRLVYSAMVRSGWSTHNSHRRWEDRPRLQTAHPMLSQSLCPSAAVNFRTHADPGRGFQTISVTSGSCTLTVEVVVGWARSSAVSARRRADRLAFRLAPTSLSRIIVGGPVSDAEAASLRSSRASAARREAHSGSRVGMAARYPAQHPSPAHRRAARRG